MFEFLSFFNNASNIISTGSTILNSYAQLRANKEKANAGISDLRYKAQKLELDVEFDQRTTAESTREYADICSYEIDETRKDQLYGRQMLGYNMLKSGIAVTEYDTAGLMVKMQAYDDEMKARSIEAQMYHKRPQAKINPKAVNLAKQYTNTNIRNIQAAEPWNTSATVLGGISRVHDIWQGAR
jgi:hypothetical protein